MKNKKIKWSLVLIILSLLLALFVAVSVPLQSKADFGNFAGESDYGDSGGDYSSDSDSDGDYSGLVYIIYLIFSILPWPVKIVLILALIVAYFISRFTKSKGGKNKRGTPKPSAPAYNRPETAYTPPKASEPNLTPINAYCSIDSGFDIADFTQKLSNLYVQMQNCWTARDLEPLRPYFTDSQYAQYERQVAELIRNRETSHIDRIAVLSVDILGFYQTDDSDHIKARLSTRITTYTVSDDTGEIVRGSKSAEKFMTYEWDLVRPKGQISTKEEGVTTIACPNCGAPLNVNASAKCEYCGAVVTVDKHDFVIYAIKGISQRTK